ISFHSDRFIHGAVYIGDFMQEFLQWLEKKGSSDLKIYENKEIELVNSSYIHNNRTIKEKKENIIRHYQQFNMFYYDRRYEDRRRLLIRTIVSTVMLTGAFFLTGCSSDTGTDRLQKVGLLLETTIDDQTSNRKGYAGFI